MEKINADVVIIGAGLAGSLCAHALAGQGIKVLLLESGPSVDRAEAVERFNASPSKRPNSPYPVSEHAPQPDGGDWNGYYVQTGPDVFHGTYLRVVGGTTWHWGGFVQRFRENDFRMRTAYGVALDWPISYGDLVPWYERAERELGVSGNSVVQFGGTRRNPYPMSEIPATYSDRVVAKAISPLGLNLGTFPQARNSEVYDDRPPCCGSASCVPICPTGAKYDASVHARKAVERGAQLVTNAVAHRLIADNDGNIRAVRFLRPDRSEGEATGKIFILSAHAIESAKLLLLSADEKNPNGIANGSDQVGRNLMTQIDFDSRFLTAEPVYPHRGPVLTSGILEMRDGAFRGKHSAIGTSFGNFGWARARGPLLASQALAAKGLRGKELEQQLTDRTTRELLISSTAETLPNAENRITLDPVLHDSLGLARPRVSYRIDDYARAGLAVARERHEKVIASLGGTEITHDKELSTSTFIIAGTARMGSDPKTSVVDSELRSHQHPNLFVVGSSAFPTVTASQPSMTISALSLRAAASIAKQLGVHS